jgi:lipoprotein-anchoring transpeptidase ErfK/SrfK
MRIYTVNGTLISSTLVFEDTFRGGIRVAVSSMSGSLVPVAVPTSQPGTGNGAGKKIVVSLSKQTLTMYENGSLVSLRRVSTGKWSTPTPPGSYRTYNKITSAYSKAYGLYMEYWMAFTADGSMGLHSLPYWKQKNGGRLYEGAAHIGTPVSHGCIRQTLAEAKSLYEWAPIGTPVIIEK